MNYSQQIRSLLARTNLSLDFDEFLQKVSVHYPELGSVTSYEPIMEGYEDANIKLFADNGMYVVKIFLKERGKKNVTDYVKVMENASALGIPVATLVKGNNGYLNYITEPDKETPYFITKFFDGNIFQRITPTLEDILIVTSFIAKLNTLDYEISDCYDSWGNKNLVKEYGKYKSETDKEDQEVLGPIVESVQKIDFSNFSKAVIHGDMQRKHVLKNKKEEYCILDFGCMAYDSKVIEVSTFLAWFCLGEDTWSKKDEIIEAVLTEYNKIHSLSPKEMQVVPLLTKAAYASYYFKTSILIKKGDKSKETQDWHTSARNMLKLTSHWV